MHTVAELPTDPVSDYSEGERSYLLPFVSEGEMFHPRKLSYAISPAEVYEEVDSLRALSFFGVDIVPFELREQESPSGSKEFELRAIKVAGSSDPKLSKPEVAQGFEELALGLTGYYYDRYSKNRPFLVDVAKPGLRGQFVYGTYEGAPTPRFVFVDLDLLLMLGNGEDHPSESEVYRSNYLRELGDIFSKFIIPLEQAQGRTYGDCRQFLREAVELVPIDNDLTAETVNKLLTDIEQADHPVERTKAQRIGHLLINYLRK